MPTCLSDDHPVWSLLIAGLYIVLGTYYINVWISGDTKYPLVWLYPLAIPVFYGFALYYLRYGVSHRSEKVTKLFEPRWLADDRE